METLHPLALSTNEDKDATCGTLCHVSCILHKSCVSHWAPINSDRFVQSGKSRLSWGSSMDRQAETRICQVFGRISGQHSDHASWQWCADLCTGLCNGSSKMIKHLKMTLPHICFVPDNSHPFNFRGS